ncbi:MAG: hypothetical protein MJZ01_00205 [Bacteroidales bacterium]|nr:hypothetical protein [Bacteroidales bacterium]
MPIRSITISRHSSRKFLLFAVVLLSAVVARAQQLSFLDAETGRMMALTDQNQYSYEHGLWLERAKTVAENATVAELDTFEGEHLHKILFPSISTAILYSIRPNGNSATIDWIARRHGERAQTCVFTDNVPLDLVATKHIVRPTVFHDMLGFEIADSITGKRLWWMPDVLIRLYFETVSDIRALPDDKARVEYMLFQRLRLFFGSTDEALTLDVSTLPRLYSVTSADNKVRVLTYMSVMPDMTSHCYGLAIKRRENGEIDIFDLTDMSDEMKNPERSKLQNSKWYGAVYYEMIETKFNKTTYYTLLGFKSNDGLVKTRVIDVLWFNGKKCMFGAPIFEHEKATYCRRVFRYSAGANMMLRYSEKGKSLIFDHLSPSNSMFIGEYEFYGPDFSYESYLRTSKCWQYKDDVDNNLY